jgi:hypothetical protein
MRKYFDKIDVSTTNLLLMPNSLNKLINLVMDVTYFINKSSNTEIGLLLFRGKEINSNNYQNILRIHLYKSETVADYIKGIQAIRLAGYSIKSFTVDNKSGLIKRLTRLYPTIPIQLCLFHFVKAVNKYLTRNPKNNCDKEIKSLLLKLKSGINSNQFAELLIQLIQTNITYLQVRNYKGEYLHRDTSISALNSITRNMNYIFTKERYPYLLIPNTTNSMEGGFGHLKPKVILHRGLSDNRKKQMIDTLLLKQNGF